MGSAAGRIHEINEGDSQIYHRIDKWNAWNRANRLHREGRCVYSREICAIVLCICILLETVKSGLPLEKNLLPVFNFHGFEIRNANRCVIQAIDLRRMSIP